MLLLLPLLCFETDTVGTGTVLSSHGMVSVASHNKTPQKDIAWCNKSLDNYYLLF
jgi:hypothetical protein